ncbi:protein Jumonji [Maniola hyperantus]|uniref:protein Jumonji n=1 Tax=Aphantopus hyperantus TaxID=2795564 RepID=UPI0021334264
MKRSKVQAQRKFAQGVFVPAASSAAAAERRPVDAQDQVYSLVNNKTSAKKILDSITFSNPGMHVHMPRVIVERLDITPTKKNQKMKITKEESTRVLRSMRSRGSSSRLQTPEDDRPLVCKYNLRRKNNPVSNGNGSIAVSKKRKSAIESANEYTVPRKKKRAQKRQKGSIAVSKKRKSAIESANEYTAPTAEPTLNSTDVAGCSQNETIAVLEEGEIFLIPSSSARSTSRFYLEPVSDECCEDWTIEPIDDMGQGDLSSCQVPAQEPLAEPPNASYNLQECSITKVEGIIEPSPISTDDEDSYCDEYLATLLNDIDTLPEDEHPLIINENPIKDELLEEEPNLQIISPNLQVISSNLQMPPHESSPISTQEQGSFRHDNSNTIFNDIDTLPENEHPPIIDENLIKDEFLEGTQNNRAESDDAESSSSAGCRMRNAPTFYPTEREFKDPIEFYKKIATKAAQYGLCKVVAPPNFRPQCATAGLERVVTEVQYPARFFKRWGEGTRALSAIRSYLAFHSVYFDRPPLVDGMEVNLPNMFKIVKKHGGFKEVSMKKKWTKVAEEMSFLKLSNPEKRLDQIYVKYLLPYDILTDEERNNLHAKVESRWDTKHQQLQKRADNPLHTRKVFLGESDESSDEGELSEEETNVRKAILDVEECVKPGRQMSLAAFRKVSKTALLMNFPNGEPTVDEIENVYWKMVLEATEHVSIYTSSVDTSQFDYGFTTNPTDPMSQHPWNLKNVRNNNENILRSSGTVVSTTVPILHFGMVFSTNCWHRDPHGLPWMEYLHEGRVKIWYGIPDQQSDQFRRAVERLCPTSVQNKTVWLPSDITMIPPDLLLNEGVTLTKVTQRPGEFIFVFPKAYSSSICTDFTISESVYFAVQPWPTTLLQVFQELRDSCEPWMFTLEHLLISIARDDRVPLTLHQQILPQLVSLLEDELKCRFALIERGIPEIYVGRKRGDRPYSVSEEAECSVCRRPLHLSQVKIKHHKNHATICAQDAQLFLVKVERSENPKPVNMFLETLISDSGLRRIISTGQKRLIEH